MYIDKTRAGELEAALAAAERGEGGAAAVAAAARRALASTNGEDFDHLVARIAEMGEALTDEDGSNDREHDTAYEVFEAAQALVPQLAARNSTVSSGTCCEWCGEAIPADAPYYEANGRQCCEPCRAAADRNGTPYAVDRTGRESNFTNTVTLYERVDREGNGEGFYLDLEDAWRETKQNEKVAEGVYTLTDKVRLVPPGGHKKA